MELSFEYLGDSAKLTDPTSYGKSLVITPHGLQTPQKIYVPSPTVPYDETQIAGTAFDVIFLEDQIGGGGGGGFTGTITVLSIGE